MTSFEELLYIQAFSRVIGVKESDVIEYTQRKGINALVENASQLLTTPTQREKHQAFLELYRLSSNLERKNPVIGNQLQAADFFRSVMDTAHDKESIAVAFLNTKNRVIDHEIISTGTISSALAHPREVFRNAVINKASNIILCHNHPSGDLTPSKEDKEMTKQMQQTGDILGIHVLDHIIINGLDRSNIFSFRQSMLMEQQAAYAHKTVTKKREPER